MKFDITNLTKNKTVLRGYEAADAELAVGHYVSALFLAGLVRDCVTDVKWTGDDTFTIVPKNWDFKISQV
jgi:hypothetical protein